ncbi:hypothetical protein [Curtobacterium sp. VKM Ac-1395]|uniref:hypothetical protein n=1 Tax=Curtobacterium sp. VKM Ac-1395 TaxID=2783815 RepID=UPI00188A22DB|nr:hypothetical protein [Curtobacterium sp. VKM Ac-1395]MBF4591013.1 hypothetical protein [Curtobacterium sp. VKM Ac-1395]
MRNLLPVLAAASILLTVAGCSTNLPAKAVDKTSTSAETTKPSPTPTADPENPKVFKFGETGTYDDGVTLAISAPENFTPGEYAAGADQATNLKFNVTVHNGSTKTIQSPVYYAQLTSGGKAASSIFDSDGGINTAPGTPLLPNQDVSFPIAFSVADPADLTMQFAVDYDLHSSATFSTTSG